MASRKAGMRFILVTLFLDILGIGLIVPILPRLMASFVDNNSSRAANYFGVFVAVYALMQFFCSPLLGSLSDRFGRRPVLLGSLFGQGLDYLLLAFSPSLGWLFLGRVIAGITGASFGTAAAYIADVSPPEKRAQNFGMIGVAFGLGFIAGPALGGILGGADLRLPFVVAACLSLANWLYGFFVLPESLAPENRRAFEWKRANPFGTMKVLAKYPVVLGLTGGYFFMLLAQRGLETTWVLYTRYRFSWDVKATGLSLALVGLCAAVVNGGLLRKILPILGERRAIVVGVLISATTFICYGLAPMGWTMYALIPLGSFGGMAVPSAQALMSKAVPPNEQGLLQGGLASLTSVSQIVGSLVATRLFAYFVSDQVSIKVPGAPFFAGAGFILFALFLVVRVFARQPAPATVESQTSKDSRAA